jgi:hypothetical protein
MKQTRVLFQSATLKSKYQKDISAGIIVIRLIIINQNQDVLYTYYIISEK